VAAGADILVAGTAIFGSDDAAALIREWHQLERVRA
jgi:pentose-5-phosphate-3-epimerase